MKVCQRSQQQTHTIRVKMRSVCTTYDVRLFGTIDCTRLYWNVNGILLRGQLDAWYFQISAPLYSRAALALMNERGRQTSRPF